MRNYSSAVWVMDLGVL